MKKNILKDPFSLVVAGVGGQGNVLLSGFVGNALVKEGFLVSVADTFGVSQRGGSVTSHIKVSRKKLYTSETLDGKADMILGMEPAETLRALTKFGNHDVISIVNPRPVYPSGGVDYPAFDDIKLAIIELSSRAWFVNVSDEALKMGNPIYANVILLGSLVGANILPIDNESMISIIGENFPGKLLDINIKAFNKGIELIKNAN
jgi:indolepyruvate ferredoxin oxidoreductase beta subunit